MSDPLVVLEAVGRTYPSSHPVDALRDVDLELPRRAYVAATGRSGSGKSTLLNLLGLLDVPTSGRYLLDGIDVSSLGDRRRTALRRNLVGFVFQSFHLMGARTVLENVELGLVYQRIRRADRVGPCRRALELVGLGERIDAPASTLSGGEAQRVAIARAVVGRPRLLLCDEPTGNLDSANAAGVLSLFRELHRETEMAIVVVTHDPAVAAEAELELAVADGRVSWVRRAATTST